MMQSEPFIHTWPSHDPKRILMCRVCERATTHRPMMGFGWKQLLCFRCLRYGKVTWRETARQAAEPPITNSDSDVAKMHRLARDYDEMFVAAMTARDDEQG